MVLTTPELVSALQHEVRILLHLASKLDPSMLDYRPTPGQRSTIDLLRYLTVMGPELLRSIKAGAFDVPAWTAAETSAKARDYEATLATLASHGDIYAKELGGMEDADFRSEIEMFGSRASRGSMIVNVVLCGCAAYRTQLFLYLKACGRSELGTTNLWAGMDAPPKA